MKVRFKCDPITGDWLQQCHRHGWTKGVPIPQNHQRAGGKDFPPEKYEQLKQRLLAVAGQAVCLHYEEDLLQMLERGEFVRGYHARMMRGEDSRCHSNAAACWDANRDQVQLMTGYALSRDGMWRQHSWCVMWNGAIKSLQVVETTEKRLLYYGYRMNKQEAEQFFKNN